MTLALTIYIIGAILFAIVDGYRKNDESLSWACIAWPFILLVLAFDWLPKSLHRFGRHLREKADKRNA